VVVVEVVVEESVAPTLDVQVIPEAVIPEAGVEVAHGAQLHPVW